jgi:DUF971 family protein
MDEFWLKINPKSLEMKGTSKLKILWADDHLCEYKVSYLREKCPCAHCREVRQTQEETNWNFRAFFVTEPPKMMGSYALTFVFNDGHKEGIYSFEFLRELCTELEASVSENPPSGLLEKGNSP